jgi:hypothetical protein
LKPYRDGVTAETPIACTLDADSMPDRIAAWNATLGRVRARTPTPDGGRRLELDQSVDAAQLAALVVAEQQCCQFLSFTITVDHRGTALEVRAPAEADSIVEALFGPAAA